MAVDKLVDSAQLESDLTDIADAIRAKTGKSASMEFPAEFVSEIGSISGGGGSSKESGSFVVSGSSQKSFTIPVQSKKTHVQVVIHGFTGTTDLSTAPYGTNKLIYVCADDTLDAYVSAAVNYNGQSITAGLGRGLSGASSFNENFITIDSITVNGAGRPMVDGATYDWEAW